MDQHISPSKWTPLKWIAERRARLSYTLNHADEVAVVLNERATSANNAARAKNEQVAALRLALAALDSELVVCRPSIRPSRIQPINSWRGKYGARGSFRNSIVDFLQHASPNWVPTDVIIVHVIDHFGLIFETTAVRTAWYYSFKSAIRKLDREGIIERDQAPYGSGQRSKWRMVIRKEMSLADLRAIAS